MERKKTIFDFFGQILTTFGVAVLLLTGLAALVGEDAKSISNIFQYGSDGIAVPTLLQFLLLCTLIAALREFFFSKRIFPSLSIVLRSLLLILCTFAVMAAFIIRFRWFDPELWVAWLLCAISFLTCFLASTGLMVLKTRLETKKMQAALKAFQTEQNRTGGSTL